MIAVAIVGILAAVAYPNFASQIRKGRRAEAVQALAQVQQAQERWRSDNPVYATNAQLTTASPNGLALTSNLTAGGFYTLAISGTPTAIGYVATATAVSAKSQSKDVGCTTLTMTVTNGSAANTPTSCWVK